MMKKGYFNRIADKILESKLKTFGAANIVGPKWCGKSTTALQQAKSSILLQKSIEIENLLYSGRIEPYLLLEGEKPRLIDEWQDAPFIWDAVRSYCDENSGRGHFILTGSSSKFVTTKHTGTGRISTMKMYPMSLYESKESNGTVSLMKLFDKKEDLKNGCISNLKRKDIIHAACRGGWPASVLLKDKKAQLAIAKDYFNQIYEKDMFSVDDVKRNQETMKAILRSYARNISTLAKKKTILEDVSATNPITQATLDNYIEILERLYIVEDIHGWSPQIRSKTAIRNGRKREFVDPSIAVAALGGSPKIYSKDFKSFGFIFETLCIRDLRVYSSAFNGHISYYHDNLDLEADCVLSLDDGRYAVIEFKFGDFEVDKGAENLNKLESLIDKFNQTHNAKIRMPDLKIVITAGEYGYKRDDGVFVIPIGCLKD